MAETKKIIQLHISSCDFSELENEVQLEAVSKFHSQTRSEWTNREWACVTGIPSLATDSDVIAT